MVGVSGVPQQYVVAEGQQNNSINSIGEFVSARVEPDDMMIQPECGEQIIRR